jgi:hypothetical protein
VTSIATIATIVHGYILAFDLAESQVQVFKVGYNRLPNSLFYVRPVNWPARSPDLSRAKFFSWGYLVAKAYETHLASISVLNSEFDRVLKSSQMNWCNVKWAPAR